MELTFRLGKPSLLQKASETIFIPLPLSKIALAVCLLPLPSTTFTNAVERKTRVGVVTGTTSVFNTMSFEDVNHEKQIARIFPSVKECCAFHCNICSVIKNISLLRDQSANSLISIPYTLLPLKSEILQEDF